MRPHIVVAMVVIAAAGVIIICMQQVSGMQDLQGEQSQSGTDSMSASEQSSDGTSEEQDSPIDQDEAPVSFKTFEWPPAALKVLQQFGFSGQSAEAVGLFTPNLVSFLKTCTATLADFSGAGTDFEKVGLYIPGLKMQETQDVRRIFGLALGARTTGCWSVLTKWEHYLMHPNVAPHVARYFLEQALPGERNSCASCSSCHKYGEEACRASAIGRHPGERRAVAGAVFLLYRMWQLVAPLPSIPALYRNEDTFDGWGLRFEEYDKCRQVTVQEKYPYDLHICRERLLKEGESVTLATTMSFSDSQDVWTDAEQLDGMLRWQLAPPQGEEFIIGAMPARTNYMRCAACGNSSFRWETSEVVLLPGTRFRIERIVFDQTYFFTTVYVRQI